MGQSVRPFSCNMSEEAYAGMEILRTVGDRKKIRVVEDAIFHDMADAGYVLCPRCKKWKKFDETAEYDGERVCGSCVNDMENGSESQE